MKLFDYHPQSGDLRQEVLAGLRQIPKRLPSKLFYDEKGSQLFDQICELEEYYPTRTELGIMQQHVEEIGALIGENGVLVEYGSGSSQKTRVLLDHLPNLAGYVPIDISREHLLQSAQQLTSLYPRLEILPVCADYTEPFSVPETSRPAGKRVIYYPGSTIGNFKPEAAAAFLHRMREICGRKGGVLIGVDLKKDPLILHRAYNDYAGVTAAFNLNMLTHINTAVGGDFDLNNFAHFAFYNQRRGSIEMHLVSLHAQSVTVGGESIFFTPNEHIITEYSYKYSLQEFAQLAATAGFRVAQVWHDADCLFSVQYLQRVD